MGLQVVNDTLANNYIRPDEAMKAQSKVKEHGRHTFIDKVKVRLVDSDYWAEVVELRPQVRPHPRALRPRLRAPADGRHLGAGGHALRVRRGDARARTRSGSTSSRRSSSPPSTSRSTGASAREFTTDEWLDLMVRSMGYEPAAMTRRLKLLFLVRLIPLGERNYNLVELGPRGTGKSYAVQELSPYAALLTGPTTVANLFGHMSGRQKGMVQIWDVVGFDEVADLQKMPKEVITTLKTYCESGTFQRGQEAVSGRRQHRHVRQHEPAGRRDGPDRPPVRADARRHPRRHGLHRPPPLLPPGLGDPEDAERALHRPLRVRRRLPGRGAARAAQAQLHRDHRPPFLARRAPQRPRPQGRAQDRLGAGEDPLPARRGHRRRSWPSSSSSPSKAGAG